MEIDTKKVWEELKAFIHKNNIEITVFCPKSTYTALCDTARTFDGMSLQADILLLHRMPQEDSVVLTFVTPSRVPR